MPRVHGGKRVVRVEYQQGRGSLATFSSIQVDNPTVESASKRKSQAWIQGALSQKTGGRIQSRGDFGFPAGRTKWRPGCNSATL